MTTVPALGSTSSSSTSSSVHGGRQPGENSPVHQQGRGPTHTQSGGGVSSTERAVRRIWRQEVPAECFIHEYDGKVKGFIHVTSRLTAGLLDLPVALLKTGAEASAFAVTLLVNLVIFGISKASEEAANKTEKFMGVSGRTLDLCYDVLKTQAKGVLYSAYAIASPQRAIDAAKKDKAIGSTEDPRSKKFWGEEANGTRNYAILSNFYKWGGEKA
ncbi:MAG TPA: hypothetical protein VLG76_03170 [Rhabdochlamydiaceae bacterium]|nr:hypothetical protein [Rhabdochlamydiaceae bacterium]